MDALGLPQSRLLMAGLCGTELPTDGPVFAAMTRAVALVMWARDCNVICAPAPGDTTATATHAVARAVASETGVIQLCYGLPDDGGPSRLDISQDMPRKQRALAAHQQPGIGALYEILTRLTE
jgi:hypothetical protein